MIKTQKYYTVIRDTREKEGSGWVFRENSKSGCIGTEFKKLDTGDYTLENYEEILCIERKGSVSEFAGNTVQKRFENELERMRGFKYSFILLEFTMEDLIKFPYNTRLPKNVKRKIMKGKFILKRTIELMMEYPNTHFIFCGDDGEKIARSIFRRIIDNE